MRGHVRTLLVSVSVLAVCALAHAVEDSTSSDIEEKLAAHDLAVVEVYRPGCSFCLKMYPIVSRFESANPATPLYRILVSDERFKQKFKVSNIPAFLVFKQGKFSHAFFGLMDSDQFYQSVYFSPVALRDPESALYGVRELMGDLLPKDLKLVKVGGGFYSITNPDETVGYGRVFLDGSVLDVQGNKVGSVYTPVPKGACCSNGK